MVLMAYPKCSTCQRAKKWLDERGMEYTCRHMTEENPAAGEIREWWKRSGLPLKKFFNTSGLKYKELGLKDRLPSMEEEEQLALLASDGMLVKRPILIQEKGVLVGFKQAQWEEFLCRN